MPALAHDQPIISAALQEWNCGLGVPSNADVEDIRAAALAILKTPSFRACAQERARAFIGADGATRGADELQELLTAVPRR